MHGVAAEIAIKVFVRFEQHHVHALPGQEQRQNGPGRPAADDTAGGTEDVQDVFMGEG